MCVCERVTDVYKKATVGSYHNRGVCSKIGLLLKSELLGLLCKHWKVISECLKLE